MGQCDAISCSRISISADIDVEHVGFLMMVGELVGEISDRKDSVNSTFDNCEYKGDITTKDTSPDRTIFVGGLIGRSSTNSVSGNVFKNCTVNTVNISGEVGKSGIIFMGGMVGHAYNITANDCSITGNLQVNNWNEDLSTSKYVGAIVGVGSIQELINTIYNNNYNEIGD